MFVEWKQQYESSGTSSVKDKQVHIDVLMTSCHVLQNIGWMLHAQQTRDVHPMFVKCWAADGGLTLNQHWVKVSCLLGSRYLVWASLFDEKEKSLTFHRPSVDPLISLIPYCH